MGEPDLATLVLRLSLLRMFQLSRSPRSVDDPLISVFARALLALALAVVVVAGAPIRIGDTQLALPSNGSLAFELSRYQRGELQPGFMSLSLLTVAETNAQGTIERQLDAQSLRWTVSVPVSIPRTGGEFVGAMTAMTAAVVDAASVLMEFNLTLAYDGTVVRNEKWPDSSVVYLFGIHGWPFSAADNRLTVVYQLQNNIAGRQQEAESGGEFVHLETERNGGGDIEFVFYWDDDVYQLNPNDLADGQPELQEVASYESSFDSSSLRITLTNIAPLSSLYLYGGVGPSGPSDVSDGLSGGEVAGAVIGSLIGACCFASLVVVVIVLALMLARNRH